MKLRKMRKPTCLILTLFCGGLLELTAATAVWTGSDGSLLWDSPNNWDILAVPGAGHDVSFLNNGSTNEAGLVNNVVTSTTTISNLNAQAIVSFVSSVTNYHTTLIDPGATLNIQRGTGGVLLNVGAATDPGNQDSQYYYTVTGSGGSLMAGNFVTPATNQGLQVTAVQQSAPNHIASLDLSGLDQFAVAGGYFWVGINGANTIPTDRPAGRLYLAKTNLIVLDGTLNDAGNVGAFRVGESVGNTPNQASFVELGQENSIYTSFLKVGGGRTALAGASMYFRTGLVNPTLRLRGTDGVNRLNFMSIGDNIRHNTAGGNVSIGTVDLSGGTVDGQINDLYVGRGATSAGAGNAGSFSSGNLAWTAGTLDVNTLYLGWQLADRLNSATGVVNVVSSDAKLVAQTVNLGRDLGASAGTGVGTLNLDGGTVEIGGSLQEFSTSPGDASSTIILTNNGVLNLQPVGDPTPATATFDTLVYSSGTVSNGILAVGAITVASPATEFSANAGTVLSPGPLGTAKELNVSGGLALNGAGLKMDVGNIVSDHLNISGDLSLSGVNLVEINLLDSPGAGSYPLMTYGGTFTGSPGNLQAVGSFVDLLNNSRLTVSFSTTAPNVSLTLDGSAGNLTWSGGNNGNAWDLKTTANWNNGAEQFYAFDAVTFDDSGDAATPVNLVGPLYPGNVAFNASSKNYTLAGGGKITGSATVTLNGSSTVTLLSTNDYSGDTVINGGTLVVGDGSNADGGLGAGTVNNFAELHFNPVSTQNVAAVITGSGGVRKRGPGVTRLAGANTFTGSLEIEEGTLRAGNGNAMGSVTGPIATIHSGATLDLAGNTIAKPLFASGTGVGGAGAILNSGPAAVFLRDVQLSDDTTFGGASGWTIQSSAANSADPGLTAYGHKITKVGSNQVKINSLRNVPWDLDLGEVEIQSGVFTLAGSISLGSQTALPITVRSNATLNLGSTNLLTKTFVFDNDSCLFVEGLDSLIDGSVSIAGNVVFDILSGRTLRVNCPITGGSLVKGIGNHPAATASTGAGTLILSGANSVSGFRVETGTVALTNDATISATQLTLAGGTLSATGRTDGTLTLAGGQSLVGRGTVAGIVSSPVGSAVTPSATNGLISITGSLTLRGTTTLDLNRSGSTVTNSRVSVSSTLDCGGSLVLTSSGQALQAGDSFRLFTAGTLLNPFSNAAITYPTLSAGLSWTNRIGIDGTVAVISEEPTEPPTLNVSLNGDGNALTITWPQTYTSFTLQAQTNSLNVGLSNNWTTITTVNNQIELPINQTNGAVFLRLIKQ